MSFSEEVFIWSLMNRAEDCKVFTNLFNPAWLKSSEFKPILEEVYNFNKKYGMPPSITALRSSIEEKDPAIYQSRYSKVIDRIENITPKPELADMVMALDKAKEVAISWSLRELIQSPVFNNLGQQDRGHDQMQLINSWIRQFSDTGEEIEMNIQEAVKYLQIQKGWQSRDMNIPCGIKVIDRMLGGGLRPKNLGIILAPTGGGKSFCLTLMAKKIATIEGKNVLFVTNELSMEETTERFISSLTSTKLEDMTVTSEDDEPSDVNPQITQLSKHWEYKLHERLRLWEVRREISTDEIESHLSKLRGLYGWKPDVIIIDYMERMKPTVTGGRRDQSWSWYGLIAKDLCRVSKAHNVVVWTAAQLNRSGQNTANMIDLTTAQGSIQHAQEAAAVIAVRIMSTPDGEGKIMGFQCFKARHAKKFEREVYYEVDVGKMIITDNEKKRPQYKTKKKDDDEEKEIPREEYVDNRGKHIKGG